MPITAMIAIESIKKFVNRDFKCQLKTIVQHLNSKWPLQKLCLGSNEA